jgi:hypothetical protein
MITKSPSLEGIDLDVGIVGDVEVDYTIDQEECSITFSIGRENEPPSDIVATISCGDAEPINIPIYYRNPTTTSITVATPTQPFRPSISESYVSKNVTRNIPPFWSDSDVICTLDKESDKFDIVVEQKSQSSPQYSRYVAKVKIRQLEVVEDANITMTISCGNADPVNVGVVGRTS